MTLVLRAKGATFTKFFPVFVLDLVPGAAAAYSTRLLSGAYTGPALRVRRSSDNTEQDIGFTSLGVLDESALLAFVGANNAFVSIWYDQSGNSRHASQATTANQPRIVNAGVVDKVNGRATPFWVAGGNNNLSMASPAPTVQTNSAFILSVATGNHVGYHLAGANGCFGALQQNNMFQTVRTGQAILATKSVTPGTFYQSSHLSDATSTFVATNGDVGVTAGAGNFTQPVSLIGSRMGPADSHVNALPEVIYYNSYKMTDRALIEANQKAAFGIA